MAVRSTQQIGDKMQALSLKEEQPGPKEELWGFELTDLYKLAVKFYKDKGSSAAALGYGGRLRLAALALQAARGPCRPDRLPAPGVLDVVGRDRRQAWCELGELGRTDAMRRYIDTLDQACPAFRPFTEAHLRDLEVKRRLRDEEREAEELRQGRLLLEEMARRQRDEELRKQADTRRQIQDALNRRTYAQFRVYAEGQYPGNPEQQAVLIRQLQQQHYQQYIQQLYLRQQQQQQQRRQDSGATSPGSQASVLSAAVALPPDVIPTNGQTTPSSGGERRLTVPAGGEVTEGKASALGARMWTRQNLAQFKEAIRAEGGSAVLTVGRGQIVTVRVPTHDSGGCLFWEFASDEHDIGFGLLFKWGFAGDRGVSVVPGSAGGTATGGEEANGELAGTSSVVPVYRRDCHLEVYAGSHPYPGQGLYLLRFDNSYCVWRSKTVYYRVYYTP